MKMVKEQNLALNPAKISGICGRLMCCMCYEHEAYHEAWEGFPNPGSKIKTPNGNVIIAGIDLPSKSLRCFIAGKGEVKVPRTNLKKFKDRFVRRQGVPEEEIAEPVLKIRISSRNACSAAATTKKQPPSRSVRKTPPNAAPTAGRQILSKNRAEIKRKRNAA
ncbi:MAG: regulatory iron-sulfur-containing complex subunit RicT [Cloacibacillus evryensis]